MRFVDEALITVRSGKGGHGCVSFRREKFIAKGGPAGGDGGDGGSVVLIADPDLLTLYDLKLKRIYDAENGKPGSGSQRHGRNGRDYEINVPVGTLVQIMGPEGEASLLADMLSPGFRLIVANGGRGGKGNLHFKSSTMRTPRFSQPGEPGEEFSLRLELKYLADAGIIGLPNAGKSTLISVLSAAKPKIANYPFTTLVPNLGVMTSDYGEKMVIADIPGLVEGASEGYGLGHRFLRHAQRAKFLVHMLSLEEAGDDPFAGFALVDEELAAFDPLLAAKPQIRVLNKIDLASPEKLAELKEQARAKGVPVHFISAQDGDGVDDLIENMWRLYRAAGEQPNPYSNEEDQT